MSCDRHSYFGCSRNNSILNYGVSVNFLDIDNINLNIVGDMEGPLLTSVSYKEGYRERNVYKMKFHYRDSNSPDYPEPKIECYLPGEWEEIIIKKYTALFVC